MDQSIYLLKGQEILRRLNELGYEAYFVGGVVRDQLLNIPFSDIDITTSATPQQVLEVVPDANREYMDLGVISFIFEDMNFEITTFRTEEYTNIRKPSQVHYSTKLREDLDRRDFTINAMAMSPNGKIYDLCEGTKDLKNKTIRIMGKGKIRFKEDPLRILRAFALISKLNFEIESKTMRAINQCKKEITKLTEAKIIVEMTKIFQGQYASKAIEQMISIGVTNYLPLDKKAFKILKKRINKLSVEEAFAICYKIAGNVSEQANLSHNSIKRLQTIIEVSTFLETAKIDDSLLYRYGTEILLSADKITKAIKGWHYKSQEKQIIKSAKALPIQSKADLAINGDDILELTKGKRGPIVGEILNRLEEKVITRELPNEYHRLKEYAAMIWRSYEENPKTEPSAPINGLDNAGGSNKVVSSPSPVETPLGASTLVDSLNDESNKFDSRPIVSTPNDSIDVDTHPVRSTGNDGMTLEQREEQLKKEWQHLMVERYKQDFNKMLNANINNLPNATSFTPEERANLASQLGPNIRQMLININIDYQKLAREGII